jgi:hypothetical protein
LKTSVANLLSQRCYLLLREESQARTQDYGISMVSIRHASLTLVLTLLIRRLHRMMESINYTEVASIQKHGMDKPTVKTLVSSGRMTL